MLREIRAKYNASFTTENYNRFLEDIHSIHPGAIEFRIAETPVFVDRVFKNKMLSACESIIDIITDPDFAVHTERSIPPSEKLPRETPVSNMIAFDFGICKNAAGEIEPQLIEMQGFPTLFGFQYFLAGYYKKHFDVPEDFTPFPGSLTNETYVQKLKEIIIGDLDSEEVILLEIYPHKQKTRIDFYCTEDILKIKTVCLTELIQEGRNLYYFKDGRKIRIRRIYNRIIFDELNAMPEIKNSTIDITADLDVQWIPHPNWFYRISKFTLPFINHPYVPQTFFLNELKQIPADLENYVLKPLFSFAGQGVIIDVAAKDLEQINDPENWILQKKVEYAPIIENPGTPAKAEIRLMYLWTDNEKRPQPAINLARLSKGKMIGVRYNKDLDWVGGSICYFEP